MTGRGHESCLSTRGWSEMERDCGTNACRRTYCYARTENESVLTDRERDKRDERKPSCDKKEDTEPSSQSDDYDDPSPCAAHRVSNL